MRKKYLQVAIITSTVILNASDVELSPISVTAYGIKEDIVKQPLSISKKDRNEIDLDQVIFQKDLLNSISDVRIEKTGSVIGHMTSIRMPINTKPYYLFMQDGIPVQSSGFFNHNGLAYTTFESASSVEVLKGAGTALYGSDAVPGIINIQSLPTPSKTKDIILRGMGGSYGYGSAYTSMSNTIDEKQSYRVNANYMHSDGWRDHTKTDRFEANARYDFIFNEENILTLMANASTTDNNQADSFNDIKNIKDGSKAASDDPNYFKALQLTDVKREFDFSRISLEWNNYSFDNLEIATTPYVRYNRNKYVATWEKNLPSSDNKLFTFGLNNRDTYEDFWGNIIFGFDSEITKSSLKYNQDFNITTTGYGAKTYTAGPLYDYDVDYYAFAPYISIKYNLTEKLSFRTGLRYDYNRFDYTNNLAPNSTDSSNTYFRVADRSESFSHISPKASISYQFNQKNNIYALYANGFRIPQANTLYSLKVGYISNTPKPEKSDTYEIGYKHLFTQKGFFTFALYYMNIYDTITRYQDGSIRYYANGGTTIHKGSEATLNYKINNELKSHIAYSYSRHNYDNNPKYKNNEMQQAPNHLANVRLIYSPSAIKGLKIMPEWQYVSSYWLDDAHAAGKYDSYSIGNLKAVYKYSKKLKFYAKITNITDEKYAVMASYAYGKTDYTPGNPRSFYAGIEYRW